MSEQTTDVIIIGSGPAGYTAAIYLGRAGYRPVVIAGALTPGGQLVNTTEVENFPGFPDGIMGPDLMDAMRKQAERFGAEIVYDDVVSADVQGDSKHVVLDGGDTYTARAVIVATGSQVRKLGVPGEAEYSGRGVSYCATCDGFFFRGKPIYVHFYSPRWICRVGNFRTYEEAHAMLVEIREMGYKQASIVKGKISVQY